MVVFKLALRNVFGAGLRTWSNVIILALVYLVMLWMQGMYAGWLQKGIHEKEEWQIGAGWFVHQDFDVADPLSYDDGHAVVPQQLQELIDSDQAVPVLCSSVVIYPNKRRQSALLKGIPHDQQVLTIPSEFLQQKSDDMPWPVVMGKRMAKTMKLETGDRFDMRWRDDNGAFDAVEVELVHVMDAPLAEIDNGQVWIDLERMREMKLWENQATMIVMKSPPENLDPGSPWAFKSQGKLLEGLMQIMQVETAQAWVIYVILLFLAMIAVFDTQMLSLFRRRKEMGTLMALGMTRGMIIRLFTLEGILLGILGAVVCGVLGTPMLWYYGTTGWQLPESTDQWGMAGTSGYIVFDYTPRVILTTVITIMVLTTVISWLPTRRITRLKPTDALRGRFTTTGKGAS